MTSARTKHVYESIERKLSFLDQALKEAALESVPQPLNLSAFSDWHDAARGLTPFSRLIFYSDNLTARKLLERVRALIKSIKKAQSTLKQKKRTDNAPQKLSPELSSTFTSQYLTVLAELDTEKRNVLRARKELAVAQGELRDARAEIRQLSTALAKVVPIRGV